MDIFLDLVTEFPVLRRLCCALAGISAWENSRNMCLWRTTEANDRPLSCASVLCEEALNIFPVAEEAIGVIPNHLPIVLYSRGPKQEIPGNNLLPSSPEGLASLGGNAPWLLE